MSNKDRGQRTWGSRRGQLAAAASQVVGIATYIFLPHRALSNGAFGHLATYTLAYITIGIPLFYMEHVVGQFTARDCLAVWHARPFLSHIGYVQILWHFIYLVYCHTVNSAVLHYFLISFEDPIPYYACGFWSTKDCNILKHNYTVNQDCIKAKEPHNYCTTLYRTYPEYQYWRYYVLGMNKRYFHIAWRVGLASLLLCVVYYLSCFKRINSVRRVLSCLIVYPTVIYMIFMIGSMRQKGIIAKFEDALDTDFRKFIDSFDFTGMISEILFALNVGTGLSYNLSSSTPFRSPCYANSVIIVVISWATTVLGICTTALMLCPNADEYGIEAGAVLRDHMSYTFEKAPRLLHAYHSNGVWLVLIFSAIFVSAITLNILILSSLQEILAKRNPTVARYPGFVTLAAVVALYIITIPLLSNFSFNSVMDFKHVFSHISVLMVMIENIVLVLWYGLERFSEDIHFMQGSQPQAWVKVGWLLLSVVLAYVFCVELYNIYLMPSDSLGIIAGWWCLIAAIAWILFVPLVRLMFAACRKRYSDMVSLDPRWGPKSEVLKRSRAMFTAHAMTKEYMYRQYHLQAGIINRQMRSNIRNPVFGRCRPA